MATAAPAAAPVRAARRAAPSSWLGPVGRGAASGRAAARKLASWAAAVAWATCPLPSMLPPTCTEERREEDAILTSMVLPGEGRKWSVELTASDARAGCGIGTTSPLPVHTRAREAGRLAAAYSQSEGGAWLWLPSHQGQCTQVAHSKLDARVWGTTAVVVSLPLVPTCAVATPVSGQQWGNCGPPNQNASVQVCCHSSPPHCQLGRALQSAREASAAASWRGAALLRSQCAVGRTAPTHNMNRQRRASSGDTAPQAHLTMDSTGLQGEAPAAVQPALVSAPAAWGSVLPAHAPQPCTAGLELGIWF